MSYIEEKKKKEMVYMRLAQIQNLKISYVCTEHEVAFMWCIGQCKKKYHTKKASWMSGYVSHISVNNYSIRVVSRVNYFQKNRWVLRIGSAQIGT